MALVTLQNTAAQINTTIGEWYKRLTGNYLGPFCSSNQVNSGYLIQNGNKGSGIFVGNSSIDYYNSNFRFDKINSDVKFTIPQNSNFFISGSGASGFFHYNSSGNLSIGTCINNTYNGLQIYNSQPKLILTDCSASRHSGDQSIYFHDSTGSLMMSISNEKNLILTKNQTLNTGNNTSFIYNNTFRLRSNGSYQTASNSPILTTLIACCDYITMFNCDGLCTDYNLFVNGSAYFCNNLQLSGKAKFIACDSTVNCGVLEIIKPCYNFLTNDLNITTYSTGYSSNNSQAQGGIKIRSLSGIYGGCFNSGTLSGKYGYIVGSTTADGGVTWINSAGINFGLEVNATSTNQQSYITFETTNSYSTSKTEKLRINSAGCVGIGTSNPSAKLDVVGTLKTSEAVSFGGSAYLFGTNTIFGCDVAGYHWFASCPYSSDASMLGYGFRQVNGYISEHLFNTSGIQAAHLSSSGLMIKCGICVGSDITGIGKLEIVSSAKNHCIIGNNILLSGVGSNASSINLIGGICNSGYIRSTGSGIFNNICSTGNSVNCFIGIVCASGVVCAACFCTTGGAILGAPLDYNTITSTVGCFCQTGWGSPSYNNCFLNAINVGNFCTGQVRAINTAKAWASLKIGDLGAITILDSFNVKSVSYGNITLPIGYASSGLSSTLYNNIKIELCSFISGTPLLMGNLSTLYGATQTDTATTITGMGTITGVTYTSAVSYNCMVSNGIPYSIVQTAISCNSTNTGWYNFNPTYGNMSNRLSDGVFATIQALHFTCSTGMITAAVCSTANASNLILPRVNSYMNIVVYGK